MAKPPVQPGEGETQGTDNLYSVEFLEAEEIFDVLRRASTELS